MSRERSEGRLEPVTSAEFRHACGRFATGVAIATVIDAKGAPHGLTVNSFCSVSLHPPLILICLDHAATAIDAFSAARHFGINVLSAGQRELSEHFARKGHDRFGSTPWRPGVTGVPLLEATLAEMECALHHRFTAGDHEILVGEMARARVREGEPLLYFASRYRRLESDRELRARPTDT